MEPSEGARRAAETIIKSLAGGGIKLHSIATDAMASIIDRETHSANPAYPFDKLPLEHLQHVNQWLAANEKTISQVKWSLYPMGMVGRWIERAQEAETHSAEMCKALGIAKGRIGFLTSCVHSGESLNAIDDTETEAALAQIEAALKGGAL